MKSFNYYNSVIEIQDSIGLYQHIPSNFIIDAAIEFIHSRFATGETLTNPQVAKDYLSVLLGQYEHEVFAALWLNTKHQVIRFDELSHGTIDGASVHIREVIKTALSANAAAVIFAHNHPSGSSIPSHADQAITERLTKAFNIIDIRVLDHFVIGRDITSFAEQGLL